MQSAEKLITPAQAYQQAQQLFAAGRLGESEHLCNKILQAQPDFHPAYFQLALIAVQVGKLPLAADLIARALKIDSTQFSYHRAIGEIYRRLGNTLLAVSHGETAVRLMPNDYEALFNLGLAYNDSGRFGDAASTYQKVLHLKPHHSEASNNLGSCLERAGDETGAMKAYENAILGNPKNAQAHNNLGALLSARGALDEARQSFKNSIQADPHFVHAHYNLSSLKKYTKDDPHLAALEEIAARADTLPEFDRGRYWFAIGKAREDVGDTDGAFYAYAQGNHIKRRSFYYDPKDNETLTDQIVTKFTTEFFNAHAGHGCLDPTPVFIVGMPRSGSTLIEQILSSHSQVFGAGELKDLDAVIQSAKPATGPFYVDWLKTLKPQDFQALGQSYINRLRAMDPKTPLITDKMPANFFYIGLIKLILPQAKIIHTMRHPMDSCFSNYARLFNETMHFAYDLEELGRYYNSYDRLMRHWHSVLPQGSILHVRYEDVVADLEAQARRIIAYCDLDWEESCLAFHENKRHVKTASIAQVRQPLYKNSVARWERFAKHLEPLRRVIEERT
jgi:Flp pilus assembly protein TadD